MGPRTKSEWAFVASAAAITLAVVVAAFMYACTA